MKKFTFYMTVIMTILITIGNSGCAPVKTAPPTDRPTASPSPAPTENQSAGKTVITYARGLDESDATRIMIDEFNKQSQTVYVKYQELPSDSEKQYAQLVEAFSSGNINYDVIEMDFNLVPEFAKKRCIASLSAFIRVDGIKTENYIPGAIAAVSYEDQIWGLPKTVSAGLLYYQKDIISTIPKTWDDLVSQASSGKTAYGFGFAGKAGDSLSSQALELIYSYGGQIVDENGQLIIDSPESAAGLKKLKELYNSSFTPVDLENMSYIDAYISFMNAEILFMRNWSSILISTAESGTKPVLSSGDIGFAQLPGGGQVMTGTAAVISERSQYKNEAWEFIKFMCGYEGLRIISTSSGRFPAMKSVASNKGLADKYPQFADAEFIEAVALSRPRLVSPYYRDFMVIFGEELSLLLSGYNSEETMLRNITKRIGEVIK